MKCRYCGEAFTSLSKERCGPCYVSVYDSRNLCCYSCALEEANEFLEEIAEPSRDREYLALHRTTKG